MARGDSPLLTEVQRDALDSNAPLADTLRNLVALGGQAGSTELREWASLELRGYLHSKVELPGYRKPGAVIRINGISGNMQITGQQISPRWLPEFAREQIGEEVRLVQPVGEIEAMLQGADAEGGSIKLTLPMSQDLVAIMNQESNRPLQQITALYWSLSAPAIAGALDSIRTTLVELVAEMRAGMPASSEVPSREVADQAVHVAVYGRGARVNVTSATASGSGSHQVTAEGTYTEARQVKAAWPSLREELDKFGVPEDELEELHTALLADGDPVNGETRVCSRRLDRAAHREGHLGHGDTGRRCISRGSDPCDPEGSGPGVSSPPSGSPYKLASKRHGDELVCRGLTVSRIVSRTPQI